jgi:8-oxo-dGTP pyrophosphatase MutT (NUDIX family)
VRALRRLALEVFGRLPAPLRRVAVQILTPHYVLGAVAVLRHEDEVLFVRSRHARSGWMLPGGLLGRGETPREAVRRELREELGLELDTAELPTVTLVYPDHRRVDLVFEVRLEQRPAVRVDGTEALAADWLTPDTSLADETALQALAVLAGRPFAPRAVVDDEGDAS